MTQKDCRSTDLAYACVCCNQDRTVKVGPGVNRLSCVDLLGRRGAVHAVAVQMFILNYCAFTLCHSSFRSVPHSGQYNLLTMHAQVKLLTLLYIYFFKRESVFIE